VDLAVADHQVLHRSAHHAVRIGLTPAAFRQ
jgi:hypothetical protein